MTILPWSKDFPRALTSVHFIKREKQIIVHVLFTFTKPMTLKCQLIEGPLLQGMFELSLK